jgi:sulfate permease, SulP family
VPIAEDQPSPGPNRKERAGDAYHEEASPFRPAARKPVVQRIVPISAELPNYRGGTLRRDLLAGLTVAALALPSGMAYAELAGLSPVAGLYALLLPTVAYTVLGSSRQLIVGPEGSIAALVATAVVPLADGNPTRYASLAVLLALMVGGVFLLARIIRLGWVADYFSRAVLIGYIHGVAVVLIVGQLGKLFGLDIGAQDPLPQLAEFGREVSGLSVDTVVVGFACLAPLLLLRWLVPKFPTALIVVVAAIGASWALGLQDREVAVVGEIPSGLPSVAIPDSDLSDVLLMIPAALGIFFVSFSDEILTARSFAGKKGQHVRAEQELAAMGVANIAAGLTQSFAVGGSGSRTAVNDQMGGRTQISGLMAAGAVALVLLFFTEPMQYLPKATLGAVIVAAAIGLADAKAWRGLARTSGVETTIAGITMVGVVIVGVLEALVVAVALSILDVVRRSATPHDAVLGWSERLGRYANVRLHPRARVVPGVLVYRLDDRLFFANAGYVRGRIHEAIDGAPTPVQVLLFDAEALTHVDDTGVAVLKELIRSLRDGGIEFSFARLKGPIERMLRETGVLELVGEENIYPTVRAAVDAVRKA